ncbi:proline-rich basic protein 1-like protein [Lates japonicus]|uniref:Proline-rich basic protein 1-like protein n=1 Tax=Lates japonicus TaxID=270547 RepID=A0AAD3RCS7_LATJO|nr:proline-rich basic protein 1-like protein [Lates japonicus]
MSRGGGGGGGSEVFLSAHRCPEVDLLPHHDSETQILPLCSQVPAENSHEFTCTGRSEADYLDVSSTYRSEEEEEEEEEGSISDWSEEDLSLHFSPSVILPSDDEESDPENCFRCVDVTMETQVTGQEGGGLKMVPKRQIHLKKKDMENVTEQEKPEKLQVTPTIHHRPDLLLRQHSMPASFHTRSATSGDVDSCRVYRGLIAGAGQGFQVGGNSAAPRRLQKSFSLDETKTKMASCIIKNVLSKKMQVEQSNTNTSHLKKPEVLPVLPPPADQQRVKEGEGVGGGAFKAPVHVVRDVRSLVKNTYSLSFSSAVTPDNHKPMSFKVIGQEGSPPPTYQQAVGVKANHNDRKQRDTLSHPITQQRRGSEPIISRRKDNVTWPVTLLDSAPAHRPSQSERAGSTSHQPSPPSPSTPTHPPGTRPPPCAQEQSALQGVFPPSAPCLYTSSTLTPHLGKVSYIHTPLTYIQLQPPSPAPTLHLLRRSEENQNTLDRLDRFIKTYPPQQTRSTRDRGGPSDTATPPSQNQQNQHHPQQQPFVCSVQGFLPAQCFYVDTPPQPQRKMLLDPETGQFIQVFLPAAGSAPNTAVFPVCCTNSAPAVLQVGGANPTVLSVMRLQPTVAFSPLYTPSCLPLTLHMPSGKKRQNQPAATEEGWRNDGGMMEG